MDREALLQAAVALIAAGSSPVIKYLVDLLVKAFEPSPKTTRRLSYLVSFVAPSVLYAIVALIRQEYDWTAHLAAVVLAFTGSQFIHGETELPGGEEAAKIKAERASLKRAKTKLAQKLPNKR